MREDLVYVEAKSALKARGWSVIAGQPPRGTDHLPVVEIKDPDRAGKGSGGAYKPDLIVFDGSWLLLGECKSHFDLGDLAKLESVLSSTTRQQALREELRLRNLPGADVPIGGFLANSDTQTRSLAQLGQVLCRVGAPPIFVPALTWPPELSAAF